MITRSIIFSSWRHGRTMKIRLSCLEAFNTESGALRRLVRSLILYQVYSNKWNDSLKQPGTILGRSAGRNNFQSNLSGISTNQPSFVHMDYWKAIYSNHCYCFSQLFMQILPQTGNYHREGAFEGRVTWSGVVISVLNEIFLRPRLLRWLTPHQGQCKI